MFKEKKIIFLNQNGDFDSKLPGEDTGRRDFSLELTNTPEKQNLSAEETKQEELKKIVENTKNLIKELDSLRSIIFTFQTPDLATRSFLNTIESFTTATEHQLELISSNSNADDIERFFTEITATTERANKFLSSLEDRLSTNLEKNYKQFEELLGRLQTNNGVIVEKQGTSLTLDNIDNQYEQILDGKEQQGKIVGIVKILSITAQNFQPEIKFLSRDGVIHTWTRKQKENTTTKPENKSEDFSSEEERDQVSGTKGKDSDEKNVEAERTPEVAKPIFEQLKERYPDLEISEKGKISFTLGGKKRSYKNKQIASKLLKNEFATPDLAEKNMLYNLLTDRKISKGPNYLKSNQDLTNRLLTLETETYNEMEYIARYREMYPRDDSSFESANKDNTTTQGSTVDTTAEQETKASNEIIDGKITINGRTITNATINDKGNIEGTFFDNNNYTNYEGEFDKKTGYIVNGTITEQDGTKISGQFNPLVDETLLKGEKILPNGDIYVGEFFNFGNNKDHQFLSNGKATLHTGEEFEYIDGKVVQNSKTPTNPQNPNPSTQMPSTTPVPSTSELPTQSTQNLEQSSQGPEAPTPIATDSETKIEAENTPVEVDIKYLETMQSRLGKSEDYYQLADSTPQDIDKMKSNFEKKMKAVEDSIKEVNKINPNFEKSLLEDEEDNIYKALKNHPKNSHEPYYVYYMELADQVIVLCALQVALKMKELEKDNQILRDLNLEVRPNSLSTKGRLEEDICFYGMPGSFPIASFPKYIPITKNENGLIEFGDYATLKIDGNQATLTIPEQDISKTFTVANKEKPTTEPEQKSEPEPTLAATEDIGEKTKEVSKEQLDQIQGTLDEVVKYYVNRYMQTPEDIQSRYPGFYEDLKIKIQDIILRNLLNSDSLNDKSNIFETLKSENNQELLRKLMDTDAGKMTYTERDIEKIIYDNEDIKNELLKMFIEKNSNGRSIVDEYYDQMLGEFNNNTDSRTITILNRRKIEKNQIRDYQNNLTAFFSNIHSARNGLKGEEDHYKQEYNNGETTSSSSTAITPIEAQGTKTQETPSPAAEEKPTQFEPEPRPVVFDGDPQYNEIPTPEGMIKRIDFSKTQLKCGENNELSIHGEVEIIPTPEGAFEKVTKVYLKGTESPNGANKILKSGWDSNLTQEQISRAEELANKAYVNKSAIDVYERALNEQYKDYRSKDDLVSFFTQDLRSKLDSSIAELLSIVGEPNLVK
ncbi:MAG: hypothetical protein RBS56_05375 [Candidatus Gracilibacteria bacterium]|jgi:hypothetical protein|nr:hypothetical protein [Candidatus Gracilibacteria bacterium]